MNERWTIDLLGTLQARRTDRVITRFRTHKTGALLAYLAFYRTRAHPREVLIDLFWADCDVASGRHNLRMALSSLRQQFELSDDSAGSVLRADRSVVQLDPSAVTTDVAAFEEALQRAGSSAGSAKAEALAAAIDLYRGSLLPGYYESWVLPQMLRLEEMVFAAVKELLAYLERTGNLDRAIEIAYKAIALDPLREDIRLDLMRLYKSSARPAMAIRQYSEYAHLLRQETGETPSPALERFAESLHVQATPIDDAGEDSLKTLEDRTQELFVPQHAITSVRETPAAVEPAGLPSDLTPFFGREDELARLEETLASNRGTPSARLLTLTGPGGSGKTRLAIKLAGRLQRVFGDAIWFVPLADLVDAGRIPETILQAAGMPRLPGVDPIEQTIDLLRQRPSLLVLDNFEHLIEPGALTVNELLQRAPTLTCLITSRQSLELEGEREFPVAPLPVPMQPGTADRLLEFASVQLFVDRAQATSPDFEITRANARAVAELCARLEGIPLALELAAARVSVLSPAQMLAQLSDRFHLLVSSKRNVVTRHRSLRAAIDWSCELLPTALRRFFARLSVFRGGWTAEAAAIVCDEPGSLDHLSQLRQRSLVISEDSGSEKRFRMLESLREYAAERLSEEERIAAAQRHARYYLDMAERSEPLLRGPDQAEWHARLEKDHDNLRFAIRFAIDTGDAESALRLCGALSFFWWVRGYASEGRQHLANSRHMRVGKRTAGDLRPARVRALIGAGMLALAQTDFDAARQPLDEALDLARRIGDRAAEARALGHLGSLAKDCNDLASARRYAEQSLALRRSVGEPLAIADSLVLMAFVLVEDVGFDAALPLYNEALAIYRAQGDKRAHGRALLSVGTIGYYQGDFLRAKDYYEQCLAICREIGDKHGIAITLSNLGSALTDHGDYETAEACLEESLQHWRDLGHKYGIADAIQNLGMLARFRDDLARAAEYYALALSLYDELENLGFIAYQLGVIADLAAARNDPEQAARLLGASKALGEARGKPVPFSDAFDRDALIARLRAALGAARFESLWAAGRELTVEQAVREGRVVCGQTRHAAR